MANYTLLRRHFLKYFSEEINHFVMKTPHKLIQRFTSKAPQLQHRGHISHFDKIKPVVIPFQQRFCTDNKSYVDTYESETNIADRGVKKAEMEENSALIHNNLVCSNVNNDDHPKMSITQTGDIDVYKSLEHEIDITNLKPRIPAHASSLAAYVNHSQTLTNLVKLGVDLSQLEKNKDLANLVLRMDFEHDVKPHLLFLHRIGIENHDLANVINKNPELLMESLEDIEVRVNYFESKRFTKKAVARIITKASKFLSMPTVEIDKRLGFIQKEFMLTGDEVRKVITSYPVIGLWPMTKLSENKIVYQEFLGFPQWELKHLLLKRPKLMTAGKQALMDRFDFLHNTMGIPHSAILNWPDVLTTRHTKLKQRHNFLVLHQRHQYDPKKPNYVSLKDLVTRTDSEFCALVAKVPVQHYDDYLKTL